MRPSPPFIVVFSSPDYKVSIFGAVASSCRVEVAVFQHLPLVAATHVTYPMTF